MRSGFPICRSGSVVSLHESTEFVDYRLALRRGLERVENYRTLPGEDEFEAIREELGSAERAAARTTKGSSFLQERRRVGRDLVIGAAVGGTLVPFTGPVPAAIAYGGIVGRSALSLAWAWLQKHRGAGDESAVARCFAAFSRTTP